MAPAIGTKWNPADEVPVLREDPYQRILESPMSFLKRLFSSNTAEPTQRVRVCVECGMPVADHKEWCSIRRGQAEMDQRKAQR